MVGFLVGAACLYLLARTLRGGGWAFAADALRDTLHGWRDDAERMRSDVARSLRGEAFDAAALEEAFARADARLGTVREALRGQAARVHEALDPRQRAELADLIDRGWRRRWNA